MEMEEEKDLPLLLGTHSLAHLEDSYFCATIESNDLSSKPPEVAKVVKEGYKEPRVVRDKVEKDKELLKEHGLRSHALRGLEKRSKGRGGCSLKGTCGREKKEPISSGFLNKPSQLTMTLFPTKFENGKIEYKIRYKGRSRPFSRAKALVTSEQSRDPTKLKELMSQVLTITLDGGTSSTNA
ncbi:unnamed protein product [Microthlaspi erraticum]|uniref:Uncharacterized protein n=1 Tax=Microthlaspi erraticum TaxID=1685480 RepID=A0A6D2JA07_9BRAS|nr:unnamed protein product [Microthlaspi erraticum]